MRKIIKLLKTKEETNIHIALIVIKKKYRYYWVFNILSMIYRADIYIWIGPISDNLYIQYDGYSSYGDDYVNIPPNKHCV